jgi:hypothetical protein
MKKENVFITATHYQRPAKDRSGQWEVTEKVEFISQMRNKHYQMATIAVDYINEKVIIGKTKGVQFDSFIEYITQRYPEQMKYLQQAYKPETIESAPEVEVKDENIVVEESQVEEKSDEA